MRAMQIIEWGKPLETREYPDPEPHASTRVPLAPDGPAAMAHT
jgi:hypothetical protein